MSSFHNTQSFAAAPSEPECNPTAIDWGFFIISLLTLHVFWWVLHIPTLFKEGIKCYINDVAWECLRVHSPSYTMLLACMKTPKEQWASRFYSARNDPMTIAQILKSAIKDLGVVAATALGMYNLLKGGTQKNLSGLNSSLWTYPSLPQALYGLLLLTLPRTKLSKGWQVTIGLLILALVDVAMALVIHFNYEADRNIWIPSTIFYVLIAFPFYFLSTRFLILAIPISAFVRNVGMIAGAMSSKAYFPFCDIKGIRLGAPLIVFTVLAGILAFVGMFKARPRDKDKPPPEANSPFRQMQEDNERHQREHYQETQERLASERARYERATGLKKAWVYLTMERPVDAQGRLIMN